MKKDVKIRNLIASLYDFSMLVREPSGDLSRNLEKVRLFLKRILDMNLFSIFMHDYLENKLIPVFMFGEPYNLVDAVNFRLGKGATGWSFTHRKPLLIKKLNRRANFGRFFVNSFLSVPTIINGEAIGAVVTGSFKQGAYGEGDRYVLEILAPYIGLLLVREHLEVTRKDVLPEKEGAH